MSDPISIVPMSIFWIVDEIVASLNGEANWPFLIRNPSAPTEKSPDIGFTPEWTPEMDLIKIPSVISEMISLCDLVPGLRMSAMGPGDGVEEYPLVAEAVEALLSLRAV